jgi:hypothetical protein
MTSENQNLQAEPEHNQILQALRQFTGTEQYYSSSFRTLNLTDGIQYLRVELESFWLIDIVESIQNLQEIKENQSFIIHEFKRNPSGNSGIFNSYSDYDEGNESFNKKNLLYTQEIPYTDFKLSEIQFYQVGDVILLKSEY